MEVSRPEPSKPVERLTKKAGILIASRTITIAGHLAAIVILTRTLSKQDFGLLSFLLLAYAGILMLSRLGLHESVFFYLGRISRASHKSFVLLTARNLFFSGLVGTLVLIPLEFAAPHWGFNTGGLLLLLIPLILAELPTTVLPNALIAIDKVRPSSVLTIITGVLQFLALAVPAILQQPVKVFVYALLIYGACRLVLSAYFFFRYFAGPIVTLDSGTTREQFRYSVPVGLSQILWDVNRQIDKYIVAIFLSVSVYAEYVVGAWEVPLIPTIAYTASLVILPRLVEFHAAGNTSAILRLWRRAIEKTSIVVLPLVVLILIAAEEIIILLFTDKYLAAALPFRIYTLIILQRVASYSTMFKAVGETRIIYRSAAYLLVTNIVLSIPFVLWLGMAGPPLATLLASILVWGYSQHKMTVVLKVGWHEVFPYRAYLKTLSVAAVSAVPVLAAELFLLSSLPNAAKLTVLIVSYLTIYFLVARLSGVIRQGQWQSLLRMAIGREKAGEV